jgi:Domain of unknown function (DUF6984)
MSSRNDIGAHGRDFRPLSELERQLLAVLLSTDFSGRDALVEQVATASVREIDHNGSLEFASSDETPAEVARRIPVEAELDDSDGVRIHVLLHVVDGFLKELEVYRDDSGHVQRVLVPGDLRLMIL